MKDFRRPELTIGVIGAGVMGRGIAQVAAAAGIDVILSDMDTGACEQAAGFIGSMLDRAVEKGRMTPEAAAAARARLQITSGLDELATADVVIEAIVEKLEIKQTLFHELEKRIADECILATNTSSLSVTALAAGCRAPGRVAGFHFFNPVPLMKLVEVVRGVRTHEAVAASLCDLAVRFGHQPVMVEDSPGFLVNHCGRGLVTEGLRILHENVTGPAEVDAAMRDCAGFRMGPFELMDLTGLDVTFPATEQIYRRYFEEPRLRPTPLQQRRYTAGLYGRKTGEGFYRYENGEKLLPAAPTRPAAGSIPPFWISHNCDPVLREKLVRMLARADCPIDGADKAGPGSIAVVLPLGWDVSTAAHYEGLDAARTVGVDILLDLDRRVVAMTSPATATGVVHAAREVFSRTGADVTMIRDSAGFIVQRIIATIVNIACDIAQQGIAAPSDIDLGARLGLGYPEGPLALGDRIGPRTIVTILESMQAASGDMRYRPSPWLKRRAQLGLSLLREE